MSDALDGVTVADTELSLVDGAQGRLVIRGLSLDEAVRRCRFEDLAALLLHDQFEAMPSAEALSQALGAARVAVFEHVAALDSAADHLDPPAAIRMLMARLPDDDSAETALQLLAAPAVFTPAVLRRRRGLAPVAPDPEAGHAADMLRMLDDAAPSAARARALDCYLVTVSDHGLNASTFAARVVASTQAGLTSAVLAAVGALTGPLHGGAPGPVLSMLDAIGTPDNAEPWLADALDRGKRLMGFGHRIYRVRDPRADALKGALAELSAAEGAADPSRVALADAVERAALDLLRARKPDRALETNVEFYTALLLEAVGFPRESFTAVFATGRVAGWLAHAREQARTGRLLRPQSRYVGPVPQAAA